jgi:arsenite-transporting ATPase
MGSAGGRNASRVSEHVARAGDGPLYYFFSGKGGVGKTTLAAATAVHLARSGLKVLISSTDPAHSLSDVFDRPIGHRGCCIEPGLHALEIDSTARWSEVTGPGVAVDGTGVPNPGAAGVSGGGTAAHGNRLQRALADLVKMAGDAPGVDEFVSLEILLETMASRAYDTVIFDTAPTGHALRLLQLPEMLDGWIGKILTLRSHLSRFGRAFRKILPGAQLHRQGGADGPDFASGLHTARGQITEARDLLTDAQRTLFALVTIPEAMSTLETTRTIRQLGDHSIPLGVVIVNQVQPESQSCPHCRRRRAIHETELAGLRATLEKNGVPLRTMESKPYVIRSTAALARLGRELWSLDGQGGDDESSFGAEAP